MTNDLEQHALRYLQQWDQRATVRSLPRFRLSAETAALTMFPPHMLPALKHEALAHLDDAARHEYSVRVACDFQDAVAALELDPVADLCGKLAIRGMGLGVALPEPVRQVALTIAADEAYHAYAAREFIADAGRLTGIVLPPGDRGNDPLMDALAFIRRDTPPELLRTAETMVLCFAENFITGELFGLSRDGASDSPFQIVVREHLTDEGRHQIFFQKLMRHLWAEIDEEARVALGRLLPAFLDTFVLNPSFLDKQAGVLDQMGFDHETSLRVLAEAFTAAYGPRPSEKHMLVMARKSLSLLATAGILDHAPTRETLVAAGWVAA